MIMVRFVLLGVEKFRKGTNVVSFGTFETRALAEARRSEIGFVRRRADPFIVEEGRVDAFRKQRLSGIFKKTFDPIKAAEVEAAKIRRQKEQQVFERTRTLAKTGTPEQRRVAILSLQSKFGITSRTAISERASRDAQINKQLREGQITTREATRLRQDPSISRGSVRALTETKSLSIFQKVPFKSITQQKVERAREIRKAQFEQRIRDVGIRGPTPTITTRGVPLTILGIPRKLEVTPVTKVPTSFERFEEIVARATTKRILPEFKPTPFFPGTVILKRGKIGEISTGIERGVFEQIREKPVTTASFFLGGAAFGVAGRLAQATRITARAFKVGTAAVGTTFVGVTGIEIAKAPTPIRKGEIVGRTGVELAAFGTGARLVTGVSTTIRRVKEFKFERGIRAFEKRITEPTFKFDPTREVFEPTGVKIIDIPKRKIIIETEPIKRGFPVFGKAGEIVGRQLQLKPRFKPEFEAQAEFIEPALGIERVTKPRDVFLGKFVERPLTPFQKELIIEPPRVIKPVIERQRTLVEFKFKPLRPQKIPFIIEFKEPPRFAGEVFQIGGLIPPQIIKPEVPFERFGGEFFERIPRRARKIPKISPEIAKRPRLGILFPARTFPLLEEITISTKRLRQIQEPISALDLKELQAPIVSPIITPISKVIPKVTLIIEPKVTPIPKEKVKPIQKPIPILKLPSIQKPLPIQIPIPKVIPKPRPRPRPIVPEKPLPIPKPRPRLPLKLPELKGIGILKKPAFTTEVREGERKGDKFSRVRKQTLPRQRAINLGARIADNTTARTFRIKRRGTTTLSDTNRFPLKDKFRGRIGKSKLPPKVFVEKSKFAIDSPGERLGIPFSPIRIPRLREAQARKKARVPKPLTTGKGRTMRFL